MALCGSAPGAALPTALCSLGPACGPTLWPPGASGSGAQMHRFPSPIGQAPARVQVPPPVHVCISICLRWGFKYIYMYIQLCFYIKFTPIKCMFCSFWYIWCCAAITTIWFHVHHPQKKPQTHQQQLLIVSPPPVDSHESMSVAVDLLILNISYKWNHTLCGLPCLAGAKPGSGLWRTKWRRSHHQCHQRNHSWGREWGGGRQR